jgi:hypothetical protein
MLPGSIETLGSGAKAVGLSAAKLDMVIPYTPGMIIAQRL